MCVIPADRFREVRLQILIALLGGFLDRYRLLCTQESHVRDGQQGEDQVLHLLDNSFPSVIPLATRTQTMRSRTSQKLMSIALFDLAWTCAQRRINDLMDS